ncbi:DUF3788 family protein [Cyclobacterium plantarum]|uniref:DUF3788 family protein n=1 Tax=Cyclobacterium plantarum TaxID=2716263 RepID=A0ABX0H5W0_9BACT|nr:DUF3788 family protein [Cyclobacterium plantarum]
MCKKKKIVWISIWENFIKASFIFAEKTRPGVLGLSFNEEIKSTFSSTKPTGKLIPLMVDIKDEESFEGFKTLLNYKKNLR